MAGLFWSARACSRFGFGNGSGFEVAFRFRPPSAFDNGRDQAIFFSLRYVLGSMHFRALDYRGRNLLLLWWEELRLHSPQELLRGGLRLPFSQKEQIGWPRRRFCLDQSL